LVTTTLYVPLVFTVMLCVAAPLLHKYAEPDEAVSVTLPPWQNVVEPVAVAVAVQVCVH
jgi:hypothetical protein